MAKKTREKFKTFENVFDKFTVDSLIKLITEGYFEEGTLSPISIGKESNVFSGEKDGKKTVIKIHRLEASDFNNMYFYIRGDPRFASLKKNKREIIFAWAQREYRNMLAAHSAEVSSPKPLAFKKNIVVMEFIGDEMAAPQVKDQHPKDPEAFYNKIIEYLRRFYKAGFVHGDLSKFNILNDNETPVLIDFSHATTTRNVIAKELLERDVKNTADFFRKLGVKIDDEKSIKLIIKK
ncbi:MAG: serine protein kinase RIO [bacterium]|nr:serine protein kinase RIO [bacterium]